MKKTNFRKHPQSIIINSFYKYIDKNKNVNVKIYLKLISTKHKIYDKTKIYLTPETFYEKFVFNKYKNKVTQ